MGTTYSVNQFDEVVPCYDGRTSNSTTDRRYTTDFEKQLLEEIKELKTELEEVKANPVGNRVMPNEVLAGEYKKGYNEGFEKGLQEGAASQAILELQGRDRFLRIIRNKLKTHL